MPQKRWALSLPLDGFSLAEHVAVAQEAETKLRRVISALQDSTIEE